MSEPQLDKALRSYFPFGFHLSRKSWDDYEIRALLEKLDAAKTTSEFDALRRLAIRFGRKQYKDKGATELVQAGQLISAGVIVDVLRYVLGLYCHEQVLGAIPRAMDWTGAHRGRDTTQQTPSAFAGLFPPVAVVKDEQPESEFLQGSTWAIANYEMTIGEVVLLSLSMANPAFKPLRPFFDDTDLKQQSPYTRFVGALEEFFDQQPVFEPLGETLFECLRAPLQAAPDSLDGQLNYIRERWASFLPPELLERLLLATDILKEEQKLRGFGPGPLRVMRFGPETGLDNLGYPEPARFSRDADWMSNVVIIAKSTYIWLDQLSQKYGRHIRHLNDIPDEELDRLARWGFSGLWLIGLWQRSSASQKIKQMMGNPEAAPSAYSLYDYVIADDLGGEAAYGNLRARAWQRGIRLASDMVPNHVGIYSKWVIEHPDWFIQGDYPPYPWYQFNGADLSEDDRVVLQIEDGYWEHRDAAVVFKRIDKWTGDAKYIYHGNDGTNMPWNDTAQLNFLLPEVREAVIQTILHVARKFPIIRFDAAMTLAKKHYQRLWFPRQGDGGAIPSRAEHGMSATDFSRVFPVEFWREVVDRIAAEVPDTLLLAEAFWLMEGYFVRTLGMHRVYNSAFMNMLKMEDNCKYRMTVKNVLEFSPEVIKRFVNFMNNPDEDTAIAQFGKGDKYFGVAVLMVTMPGLPMFGHGQIEGFTEKYGMEYRRAYWDEQIDEEMVRRHEREIFPLMQRRRLFSGAANFAFFDFNTPEGWVDENVFAYSNRAGDERAIILYNNAYNTTRGTIHTSTAINAGSGEDKSLIRRGLAEALGLRTDDGWYYTFRDYQSGLNYLRSGKQMAVEGLFAELQAYQYHAFLDFREIHDTDGSWAELARRLAGNGVADVDEAYREMQLDPVLVPFRKIIHAEMLKSLAAGDPQAQLEFSEGMGHFLTAARDFSGREIDIEKSRVTITRELHAIQVAETITGAGLEAALAAQVLSQISREGASLEHIGVAWIAVHQLNRLQSAKDAAGRQESARTYMHDWLLYKAIRQAFRDFCGDETTAHFDTMLVSIMTVDDHLLLSEPNDSPGEKLETFFADPLVGEYLQFNRHNGALWLNKEQLERLVGALLLRATIRLTAAGNLTGKALADALQAARHILNAADQAGYRVDRIIATLK